MDLRTAIALIDGVGPRLREAGFGFHVTGHVRLELPETTRPYILVTPPDRQRLRGMFNVVRETAATMSIADGPVTFIPCLACSLGAHQIVYTGPVGYVRYLMKWAVNLGYQFKTRGDRPGIYHRQTLLAAVSERAIFTVLGVGDDKQSLEFRRQFWFRDARRGMCK